MKDSIFFGGGLLAGLYLIYIYNTSNITLEGWLVNSFIIGVLIMLISFLNAAFFNRFGIYSEQHKRKKFKFSLDIHGVCDTDPQLFSELSRIIVESGNFLYILTGKHINDGVVEELEKYGIMYTHLFSIADFHKAKGTIIRYDDKGTPWIDEELWNKTKGEYCRENEIDLHIDDSSTYGKYFSTSYAQAKIKKRTE
jgi:hypothetical protein